MCPKGGLGCGRVAALRQAEMEAQPKIGEAGPPGSQAQAPAPVSFEEGLPGLGHHGVQSVYIAQLGQEFLAVHGTGLPACVDNGTVGGEEGCQGV